MRLTTCVVGIASFCLVAAAALADLPVDHISLFELEKKFEKNVYSLWGDDRYMFQQLPRAYYVNNFGVLLTSEFSIAPGPGISPFLPSISKQTVIAHKKVVLGRVPKLRDFMKAQLLEGVAMFPNLPDTDRFGIAVTIYHISWEDISDIPTQVVVQGTKKALLAARANVAMRDQAIEMKELY